MADPKLTAERVRDLLDYDPLTGLFKWRINRRSDRIGAVAGHTQKKDRYVSLRLDRERPLGHRVAWLYIHGTWPSGMLDHIDGNPSNNRISNLREVTTSVNGQNRRRAAVSNKTGYLGVTKSSAHKFAYSIKANGKIKRVCGFPTAEAAHAAYVDDKRRLHEGCTI